MRTGGRNSTHPPCGGTRFLKNAPAATQMRNSGILTMIDRKAEINLNVSFRGMLAVERLRPLIKLKEETHVELTTISRLPRRGCMAERRTARPMRAGRSRAVSVPGSDPDDLQRRVYASP